VGDSRADGVEHRAIDTPDQDRSNNSEVYTRKGRAEVTYRLSESNGETAVTMRVEGYPPAPGFLADFFATELADYAESQQ
jgi:hypothetical protein